jgi:aspartate 1-decarboxylase
VRYNTRTMLLTLCKAKIHRACVTQADLDYVGSITLDADLLDAAGIVPHERVQVLNLQSGARLETYVIVGERGSGTVCLNGPAAHRFAPGDVAIIVAYAHVTPEEATDWHPTVVFVDGENKIAHVVHEELPLTGYSTQMQMLDADDAE